MLRHTERLQRRFLQAATLQESLHLNGRVSWAPPVNIVEKNDSVWVIFAVPGVPAGQVELRLEGGDLIITGQRPLSDCCADGALQVLEIPFGRFERRLRLPVNQSFAIGETRQERGLVFIQLRKL